MRYDRISGQRKYTQHRSSSFAKGRKCRSGRRRPLMQPISIFFLIFAGMLFAYGTIMSLAKNRNVLPYRIHPTIRKDGEGQYIRMLGRLIMAISFPVAAGAIFMSWN